MRLLLCSSSVLLSLLAWAPADAQVDGASWSPGDDAQSACSSCAYTPPPDWIVPLPSPQPIPAQCFAKVLLPPVAQTVEESVLVAPGGAQTVVIPGGVRLDARSVLQKEAAEELVSIPPTYRTVLETVVTKKASTRIEVTPAVYDTVVEQVKVKEAHQEWRPGSLVAAGVQRSAGAYGRNGPTGPNVSFVDHDPAYGGLPTRRLPTGEVLCLVNVPAEYMSISKQVLRTPSHSTIVATPEETATLTRQVVDQPAHVERRIAPAVYGVLTVQSNMPDVVRSSTIAPTYQTVLRTKVVSPTRFEWRPVACDPQTTGVDPAAVQPYP